MTSITTSAGRTLIKRSLPVMCALTIQSVYNIADSYFIAKTSLAGLTALSIFFPIQLLMTAVSTGIGSGIGILVARCDGQGETTQSRRYAGAGLPLSVIHFIAFTLVAFSALPKFMALSTTDNAVRTAGLMYGTIVLWGSLGLFVESAATKILQAKGQMKRPMAAQLTGALLNIILDPILIFPMNMGIRGAALATIIGQWAAMVMVVIPLKEPVITLRKDLMIHIYKASLPSVAMQALYTVYIIGLNLILKQFGDSAVTVLGIYYKLQTFFFIPVMGLQQALLPLISYYHGEKNTTSQRHVTITALVMAEVTMAIGFLIFISVPGQLITLFSRDTVLLYTGTRALRIIALSFLPAGLTMVLTIFFQGADHGLESLFVTILRQVILLVPLAWLLSHIGLHAVWWTFPLTEVITAAVSLILMHTKENVPTHA